MTAATIIHAGLLIAVPGSPPLKDQTIVVRAGKVEAIRPGFLSAADIGEPVAAVIDLSRSAVLPGLIDAHVHLTIGWPPKLNQSDADAALVALENARKTLAAGFTTVRDVGAFSDAIFSVRDAINKGRFDGPRILAAGDIISVTNGHGHGDIAVPESGGFAGFHASGICDGPFECRKAVRTQIMHGADVIKIATTKGGNDPRLGAAPSEMMDDEIVAAVTTAHAAGRKVAAHAHSTAGIDAALAGGVDSIEHGGFLDKGSIALFKKSGAFLVPTMVVLNSLQAGYDRADPQTRAITRGFLDNMPNNIGAAYRAGVPIAFGTDAGITPHGKQALEFLWYRKIGMTPGDVLRTATTNAAKLLGLDAEIGTIEAGKRADIIATGANPLDDVATLQHVTFVMAAGRVVKDEE
ncbi:amidohydrolase family protein [Sphingopyxis sp.]|uniref:metal-dependent hydrolase family protein n=1 Tax=Sphingopyxis sp. TaxID=1908224 RepID=UPI0026155778|nr:amidohydrolase family protein [Sphingopyxis sp.]MCW0199471.1 amidohydrolase family protein [Sphingopyxis sp.]